MTQPEKPPYITDHTWAGLSRAERAGIAAGWQAMRRQEVGVVAQPTPAQPASATRCPPDTPLNVLEEMLVERFLSDVGWGVAVRDDARVAGAVAQGEEVDAVYTLEDAAALDEFFQFLKTQGFVQYFEELAERMRVQRINVRTYRILDPQPAASSSPLASPKPAIAPAASPSTAPTARPRLQTGMTRYRRELLVQNRNKVILFLGDVYGILHVQEMAMLSGVRIRDRSPGVGTREQTLQKYGLWPQPGGS